MGGAGEGERIGREATAWFVRMRNPQASAADRRLFREWLAADAAHGEAFAEVEALWRDLDGPAAAVAAERRPVERPRRRMFGWRRAAAMSALIAASVAVVLWRDPGVISRARADHATRPGERLDVSLGDGTALYLDADSAVSERLAANAREVTVLRGRVYFDVAKDAARPFVVHADDIDVRVLGTAFGVDRDRGIVTVERGAVSVAEAGEHFRLAGGDQVESVDGRLAPPEKVDPATALAWRRGLVVLDAAPLGDVLAELGRMSGRRVVAPQSEVRAMKLSGTFKADDPDALKEAMRRGLGLSVVEAPGLATLVYR